jgi:hypothetical protein
MREHYMRAGELGNKDRSLSTTPTKRIRQPVIEGLFEFWERQPAGSYGDCKSVVTLGFIWWW